MNWKFGTAAALLIAGAGVIWLTLSPGTSPDPGEDRSATPEASLATSEAPRTQIVNDSVEAEVGEEYEIVLGVKVAKDRDCDLVRHSIVTDEGEQRDVYQCIPLSEPQGHPFTAEDDATLLDMAYRDATASHILGLRYLEHGDEAKGLEYLYRSIALSSGGNTVALADAANAHYASVKTLNEAGDLVPHLKNLEQQYVFEQISNRLGGQQSSNLYRSMLEEAGRHDFSRLDESVREALEQMAEIELEVVGAATIKEKIDA